MTKTEMLTVVLLLITIIASSGSLAYIMGLSARTEELTSEMRKLADTEGDLASELAGLGKAVGAEVESIRNLGAKIAELETRLAAAEKGLTPKTIRFWSDQCDPWQVEVITAMARSFEEENPGVFVDVEYLEWGDYYPKLMAAIEAGSPPECGIFASSFAAGGPSMGIFLPLDDVIAPLLDDLEPNSLCVTKQTINGEEHYWTIPYSVIPTMLWIRTDVFQENGLAYPETWDDLLACAKALTKPEEGKYGIGLPFGRNEFTGDIISWLMWQNGGATIDEDGKPSLNTPENLEALKFLAELAKYAPPGATEWAWYDVMNSFVTGAIPMVPYWGRTLQHVHKYNPDIEPYVTVVHFPKKKVRGAEAAPQGIGVFKGCPHPDLAKKWVTYFLTCKDYVKFLWAVPGHSVPPFKSKVEEWSQHPLLKAHPDYVKVVFEVLSYAAIRGKEPGRPINPYISEIYGAHIMEDIVQKVVIAGETPEDALAWGQEQFEAIMGAG